MLKKIKSSSLNIFNKFLSHESTLDILTKVNRASNVDLPKLDNLQNPYYKNKSDDAVCLRDDIIFVTSRFRSGSTVFWNLFRQLPGCTSYYEPFNERQWFSEESRGNFVDKTHLGVSDYWTEFQGLEELSQYYQEDWIRKELLMGPQSWNGNMLNYIKTLISSAPGRSVLQFNRIDFRLPWIKHYFPNAKILHLYRHPRDQWCSFLTDKNLMNKDDVIHTYKDAFYLNMWCADLKKHYPFLDEKVTPHPYQRFYYLWKLSYLHGVKFSSLSLSYESFDQQLTNNLADIASICDLDQDELVEAAKVFKPAQLDKWKSYADAAWFESLELECETTLSQFLGQ